MKTNKEDTKILLVISNYNEEGAILSTIQDVRENNTLPCDILVIDNCSSDSSIKLIKGSGSEYLWHPVNSGGCMGVVKTAFLYAYYHDYDLYCHMDGDNQHIASEVAKLVEPIIDGSGTDATTGSRFISKNGYQSTRTRRMGIYLFSKILSAITGRKFTDVTSGFRAYNKRVIEFFATRFKREIETITQMELAMYYEGFKTAEVAVEMRARVTGKSIINLHKSLRFPISNMISLIGMMIQVRGKRNAI